MAKRSTAQVVPLHTVQVPQTVINNHEPEAYTIDEFCAAHRIGKPALYALVSAGKAPKIMRFGLSDVRISREAAKEWREGMAAEWTISEGKSSVARAKAANRG